MHIPPGFETIPQRADRTGEAESTIRYQIKTGKLPYKKVKIAVVVIPKGVDPYYAGASDRQKQKARMAVRRAVKDGTLAPRPCEECGAEKAAAYHGSYAEEDWLKVRWLCKDHRPREHKSADGAS